MMIVFSMNPETIVTFTCGHFNQVVFAVKGESLGACAPRKILISTCTCSEITSGGFLDCLY